VRPEKEVNIMNIEHYLTLTVLWTHANAR